MTVETALRTMRELCLSLPNASESEHFGEACFRVGKKIVASCGVKDGACRIVVQLEPEHARQLLAADPRFQAYGRQKHCVWIDTAAVADLEQIRSFVLESYRLNVGESISSKKPITKPRKKGTKNG